MLGVTRSRARHRSAALILKRKMGSAAAIAIVGKLAPIIAAAMAPEVAALFKSLPFGLVAAAPNSDVEIAVAANVARAMPAVTAATFATGRDKIRNAVAIYPTQPFGDDPPTHPAPRGI